MSLETIELIIPKDQWGGPCVKVCHLDFSPSRDKPTKTFLRIEDRIPSHPQVIWHFLEPYEAEEWKRKIQKKK